MKGGCQYKQRIKLLPGKAIGCIEWNGKYSLRMNMKQYP